MNVSSWLKNSKISRLDAELILAEVLEKDRTFLVANSDLILPDEKLAKADELLLRRQKDEPLAYILGKKWFYGREFEVSPDVLIPRPETEDLVDMALEIIENDDSIKNIVDVGTGSGCIAISIMLECIANERKQIQVLGLDISDKALTQARRNAEKLSAPIKLQHSDLLSNLELQPDIIVANLPYVDKGWTWNSACLKYEPELALYADDGGLELIWRLMQQAKDKGAKYLLLESDISQHERIVKNATKFGWRHFKTEGLITGYRLLESL